MLHRIHTWLTDYATTYRLKPQIEMTRTHLVLVVGSAELGRCELITLELTHNGLTHNETTMGDWSEVKVYLDTMRGQFDDLVGNGLVKSREVEMVA